MTAEIAVLNKSAVALAADSAVTISTVSGEKVYNTVNKLFCLTKHHPVGVMVYGSAEINGVPWETLIKTYRAQLGNKAFSYIEDYGRDFIRFLNSSYRRVLKAGEADFVRRKHLDFLLSAKNAFVEKDRRNYRRT